jgi:hypothetical protein
MGPSFTGKAARDRDCGDHSSQPGGASSGIPRTLNTAWAEFNPEQTRDDLSAHVDI